MKKIATIAMAFFIAGCVQQTLSRAPTKSYQVGQIIKASPGGTFLSSQDGQLRTVKKWVGLLNSPDGWEISTASDSSFIKKELIYSGVHGTSVEIGYREYRGGLAAPAFFQSAKYDLSSSKEITFQNFRFRIESADNNGMIGILLSDGITTASSEILVASENARNGKADQGKFAPVVERLAREQSCSQQPISTLISKGAGYENHSVACTNGDTIMYRCDFGNCRELK